MNGSPLPWQSVRKATRLGAGWRGRAAVRRCRL